MGRSSNVKVIRDYGHAVETYNAIKPWKACTGAARENPAWHRPLDRNRAAEKRIGLNPDNNSVEVWHWNTKVITYWPNGEIEIVGYNSYTTMKLMHRVLSGMSTMVVGGDMGLVIYPSDTSMATMWNSSEVYRFDGRPITVVRCPPGTHTHTHKVVSDVRPWTYAETDTRLLNKVCREVGIADFRVWEIARRGMDKEPIVTGNYGYGSYNIEELLDMVVAKKWEDVYQEWRKHGPHRENRVWTAGGIVTTFVYKPLYDVLRDHLMHQHKTIKVTRKPVISMRMYRAIASSERKYKYIVDAW